MKQLRKSGENRLFPMFGVDKDGYGAPAGRWHSRWRKSAGCTSSDYHGLRQTFITRMREVGVPPDVISEIVGHSLGSTMMLTTYANESSLGKLRDAMEKLRFDQL